MSGFATANFPCPTCGALFALTPKVATRKIQCPCGKVFVAPPMPLVIEDPDPYNVAHHAPDPETKTSVAKSAATRMPLYPHKSLKSYSTDTSEPPENSLVRDWIVPIIILVVGLGMRVAEIPYDHSLGSSNILGSVAVLLFQVIVAVGLMLAGVYLGAKILGTSFGTIPTAIIKLAGLSIFAWAACAMIVIVSRYNPWLFRGAIGVMFIIQAMGFATLFNLDAQEAMTVTVICAFLQDAAGFVMYSSS